MPRSRTSGALERRLLALLAALAAGVGFLSLFLSRGPERAPGELGRPAQPGQPGPVGNDAGEPRDLALPEPRLPSEGEEADTTVLWPLRIELELVRAAHWPSEEGIAPIGTGRSARLSGRITDARGEAARAEVHFVHGANRGRVLRCDATGSFGASDLYPGLSIVEVKGERIVGSRREVRLRQGKETLLNLGYGRPASVSGRVLDGEGEGIEGARVSVDGSVVFSGAGGEFHVSRVAGGQALCEVKALGFADHRELVSVMAGRPMPVDRLSFALRKACSLTIAVPNQVGGPGPVQVYLLGALSLSPERRFPWYERNPIEIPAGSSRRIEGLPPESVRILAFRPRAKAPQKVVTLGPSRDESVSITLEPCPRIEGRVLADGNPAPGVLVRLSAPDPVRALLAFFREPGYFLEGEVLPLLPPVDEETATDAEGRFAFSAWPELAPAFYLEARDASGRWDAALARPGSGETTLELEPLAGGDCELRIEMSGRWQGLPVDLFVNGATYDPTVLPAHEALRVGNLVAGTWRIGASWRGRQVLEERAIEIRDLTDLTILLPAELIEGQDEEAWRRAGKEYPFGG